MEIHDNETSLDKWTEIANGQGYKVEWDEEMNTWFAEAGNRIRGTFCLDDDCTTRAWIEWEVQ